MRVLTGVVYMTKSSGPRTEPWWTRQEDVCQEDKAVTHLTRKGLDDICDLNQLRTEPWMPNQDERRMIKMSWSVVGDEKLISVTVRGINDHIRFYS